MVQYKRKYGNVGRRKRGKREKEKGEEPAAVSGV